MYTITKAISLPEISDLIVYSKINDTKPHQPPEIPTLNFKNKLYTQLNCTLEAYK